MQSTAFCGSVSRGLFGSRPAAAESRVRFFQPLRRSRFAAVGAFERFFKKMNQAILKSIFVAFACLLAGAASLSAHAEDAGKFRVAIGELKLSKALSAAAVKAVEQSTLRTDIEAAVRNARKFDVVARDAETINAIRDEQKFAQSGLAAGDAAFEGQLSNAQALIIVEVQEFAFGRSSSKVPNIDNKYRVSDYASIELNVSIVDTTAGQITGSFNVKAKASSPQAVQNSVGSANKEILGKAIDRAAAEFVDKLTDTVFPIQVVQVKGKQLYINRGNDGGMKVGDQFVIFSPGEDLVDPATGESLGSAEEEAGLGKVTRVNPKFSIVEVVKGDAAAMEAGFILRRPVKEAFVRRKESQMNFKKPLLALLLALAAGSLPAAGVRVVSVEAEGIGLTRQEAVDAALAEAVSKVNGMVLAAQANSAMADRAVTKNAGGQEQTESLTQEDVAVKTSKATAGIVRSYQIISVVQDQADAGRLVARLSVDVAQFEKGRESSRMRLAVLPFSMEGAGRISAERQREFLLNLNQAVVSHLTSTRHFAVLDKDFSGQRKSELAEPANSSLSVEERARLGQELAADYIITGRVLEFDAKTTTQKVPYTGEMMNVTRGKAAVQFRVIEASTGQVAVSGSRSLAIRNEEAVVGSGTEIGKSIGEQIAQTIYPIAAISFENGELALSQGGETIRAGDIYSLVRLGAVQKDPYTKESLGRRETPVGTVRIARVTPKAAYARIIECSVDLSGMAPREYLLRPADGGGAASVGSSKPKTAKTQKPAW